MNEEAGTKNWTAESDGGISKAGDAAAKACHSPGAEEGRDTGEAGVRSRAGAAQQAGVEQLVWPTLQHLQTGFAAAALPTADNDTTPRHVEPTPNSTANSNVIALEMGLDIR